MVDVGAGAMWTPTARLILDLQFRYGRIFAEDGGINVVRAGIGVGTLLASSEGARAPMSPSKRGRPQKFGRPSQVVALTLPEDVLRGLRKIHHDLGWAIVALFEK
jgi:hypothetical protein